MAGEREAASNDKQQFDQSSPTLWQKIGEGAKSVWGKILQFLKFVFVGLPVKGAEKIAAGATIAYRATLGKIFGGSKTMVDTSASGENTTTTTAAELDASEAVDDNTSAVSQKGGVGGEGGGGGGADDGKSDDDNVSSEPGI